MSQPMTPAPKDSPLMLAWEAYKQSEDFANGMRWALRIAPMVQSGDKDGDAKRERELMSREQRETHVQGSLWAAFAAGFLHTHHNQAPFVVSESVKPDTAKVPEGWKLVPIVPTEEMMKELNAWAQCEGWVPEGYAAMLAAAPSPSCSETPASAAGKECEAQYPAQGGNPMPAPTVKWCKPCQRLLPEGAVCARFSAPSPSGVEEGDKT